jgi:hypothetical protein
MENFRQKDLPTASFCHKIILPAKFRLRPQAFYSEFGCTLLR